MPNRLRRAAALAAGVLAFLTASAAPARAQAACTAGPRRHGGRRGDRSAAAGARVVVARPPAAPRRTGADGRFHVLGLPAGTYRLRIERAGYQPAESAEPGRWRRRARGAHPGAAAHRVGRALGAIGSTATARRVVAPAREHDLGRAAGPSAGRARHHPRRRRAARAARHRPTRSRATPPRWATTSRSNCAGSALLETTTALDGHPIALGFPGGYNFQLSLTAGLRDIVVTYGSGSNLLGTSAIGGIIDLRTLEPTAEPQFGFAQGWGTFAKSATTLRATGTTGRLGYALAFGVAGLDGPVRHARIYQPGAAYDQSATDPAVRATGVDGATPASTRAPALLKLSYAPDDASRLTLTSLLSTYFEDKSGNGDRATSNYAPARFRPAAPRALQTGRVPAARRLPGGHVRRDQRERRTQRLRAQWPARRRRDVPDPAAVRRLQHRLRRRRAVHPDFDFADQHLAYARTHAGAHVPHRRLHRPLPATSSIAAQAPPFARRPAPRAADRAPPTGSSAKPRIGRLDATAGPRPGWLQLLEPGLPARLELGHLVVAGRAVRARVRPDAARRLPRPRLAADRLGRRLLRRASATRRPRSTRAPRSSTHRAGATCVRLSAGATTTEPAGDQLGRPFVGTALGGAAHPCGGLNPIGGALVGACAPSAASTGSSPTRTASAATRRPSSPLRYARLRQALLHAGAAGRDRHRLHPVRVPRPADRRGRGQVRLVGRAGAARLERHVQRRRAARTRHHPERPPAARPPHVRRLRLDARLDVPGFRPRPHCSRRTRRWSPAASSRTFRCTPTTSRSTT